MNGLLKRESICQSSGDSDDCMSDDGNRGSYCPTSMVAASSSSSINPGRKRRRGIIEKRRRDRINQSLSELKRLVPAALEKSNSAKLEKAEILQMTVEHLKMVNNNRGNNGYTPSSPSADPYTNPDAHRIAVDYHLIGFKECAAEVARYFSAVEGMDISEPARMRLMTHLQMFASQKESYAAGRAAAAAAAASTSSSTTAATAAGGGSSGSSNSSYGSSHSTGHVGSGHSWSGSSVISSSYSASTPYAPPTSAYDSTSIASSGATSSADPNKNQMEGYFKPIESHYGQHYSGFHSGSGVASGAPTGSAYFPPTFTPPVPPSAVSSQHQPISTTAYASYTSSALAATSGAALTASAKQPYRPWGAEMASC